MRVMLYMALAALALACEPSNAQTAADKSSVPQTLTEGGGVAPQEARKTADVAGTPGVPAGKKTKPSSGSEAAASGGPTKSDKAHGDGGRVGSLSPDEARRAARARGRAAANAETSSAKKAPAAKEASAAKEAKAPEAKHDDADVKSEPAAKKAGTSKPTTDAARTGSISPDEERRAARARERATAAPPKPPQSASREDAKSGPTGSSSRPEREATEPRRSDAEAATADRHPIQRHAKAPDEFSADRGDHPQEMDRRRSAYRTGTRRPLSRADIGPQDRALRGEPVRGPRVGDVIPPGVPLYPLPPGYRPPMPREAESAFAEPRWRPLPPPYPPYP